MGKAGKAATANKPTSLNTHSLYTTVNVSSENSNDVHLGLVGLLFLADLAG